MQKETTTHYLHMQEDGQYITLQLLFTIMPNVSDSVTRKLEQAETMLSRLEQGTPSEPIFKTLKTIEVDED